MNLRLQEEQGRLVNMLDSDGHGGQVRWRGSMGVENFDLGVSWSQSLRIQDTKGWMRRTEQRLEIT